MAGRTGHQEAGEDGSLLEDQARSADLLPEEFRAHEEGGISGHVMIFLIFFDFLYNGFFDFDRHVSNTRRKRGFPFPKRDVLNAGCTTPKKSHSDA